MEEKKSIMDLVNRYGLSMPKALDLTSLEKKLRTGIIVIVCAENEGSSETVIGLRDAKKDAPIYFKHYELWDKSFYKIFELFFIPRERQQDFVCDFVKLKGRLVKVHANPLFFKGLSWEADNYWAIILNDNRSLSAQGELFPVLNGLLADKQLEINVGNLKIYHLFLNAFQQKKFLSLDVYRLNSADWNQFFSIHDWYTQREIRRELEEEGKPEATERETA